MNYGWGDRIQLKYELPLAAGTDTTGGSGLGLGESLLGVKWRYFEYHKPGEPKSDDNLPKQGELTLDFGGRRSLDKGNHLRLLFMGGRAIQDVTRTNGEPSWIAYLGIQLLLGPKKKDKEAPAANINPTASAPR